MVKSGKMAQYTYEGDIPAQGTVSVQEPLSVDDNGGSLTVDASSLPLPTGAATAAKQDTGNTSLGTIATNTTGVATSAKQDTGNTSLGSIDTKLSSQATAANQTTGNSSLATIATNTTGVATAANQSTANSSLSTIATNTTGVATAANQSTANSSLSTIATNSSAPSTATVSRVATSGTVATLAASNSSRKGLDVQNESSGILYVKFGSAATTTDYTLQIPAGGYWEMPTRRYTGIVTGILSTGSSSAQVTET